MSRTFQLFNGIPWLTYLLSALALLAANWARFFTALVDTIFRFDSFKLCVELRQSSLLKLMGTGGGWACFKPNVTWSTDNCLRRLFLLSLAGLSFKSIDFCLRNKFFALLGWNCCRMVDILSPSSRTPFASWAKRNLASESSEYFHDIYYFMANR